MEENNKNGKNSHSSPYNEWPVEWQKLIRLVYTGRFRSPQKPIDKDNPITTYEIEILALLIPEKELINVICQIDSGKLSFAQIIDFPVCSYSVECILLMRICDVLGIQVQECIDKLEKLCDDQEKYNPMKFEPKDFELSKTMESLSKIINNKTDAHYNVQIALSKMTEMSKNTIKPERICPIIPTNEQLFDKRAEEEFLKFFHKGPGTKSFHTQARTKGGAAGGPNGSTFSSRSVGSNLFGLPPQPDILIQGAQRKLGLSGSTKLHGKNSSKLASLQAKKGKKDPSLNPPFFFWTKKKRGR